MGVGRGVSEEVEGVGSALLLWLLPFPLVNPFCLVGDVVVVVLVVDVDVDVDGLVAVSELCWPVDRDCRAFTSSSLASDLSRSASRVPANPLLERSRMRSASVW